MGNLRIFRKALTMTTRSKRRFFSAIGIYCVLSWWVAFSIHLGEAVLATMGILGGLMVAVLYGFVLSQFRKTQIATLKCIGWGNDNIRLLMIGELLLVSLLGFVITLEIDIHILGLTWYIVPTATQSEFVFSGLSLALTFMIVIVAQLPGIVIAHWRTLQVRPMVALKA
ncbi:MAG: FtsX-like permease family protein [Candidatus Hodarchaeota archaeon]